MRAPRVPVFAVALVSALGLLAPSSSHAQAAGESGWRELFSPERHRGRRMMRLGLAKLTQAMGRLRPDLGDQPQWLLLDEALLRFGRARRHLPDDPELAYYRAYALTRWERGTPEGGVEYRAEEAIEAWQELRRLDPDFLPDRVAYELAMLHMKRQEFTLARDAYRAALAHSPAQPVELFHRFYIPAPTEERLGFLYGAIRRDNIHGNLAEVLMLTGEVQEAIPHYRAAHDDSSDVFTRSLAQWGLALSHDRAGDHREALEWAARALRETPINRGHPDFRRAVEEHGRFAILHLDFVYFEPGYELHAYEALGHEALATTALDPDPDAVVDALRSWRLFLAEGGVSSRFAAQARAHVDRLEAEIPEELR